MGKTTIRRLAAIRRIDGLRRSLQSRPNRGSRARKVWRGSLAKVIKKSIAIAELMTGKDTEEDLRILRDAKKATHRVFNFETKKTEEVADHKTRLAAFALSRAYHEGKPVERAVHLNVGQEDFAQMLERYRNSPEFKRIYGDVIDVNSLQSGQNVTNQESPTQGSSDEIEPTPGAEK